MVLATVVRLAGVVLLAVSAVLGLQAWWSRFGVCSGGPAPSVTGLPADGAAACEALQDHKYDYDVPEEPWVPIADAAQREGLSLIALGVGVTLVCLSLGGRWLVRALSLAGGVALGAMWVGLGVPVWRMGESGVPTGFDAWMTAGSVGVLTLLATPALAVLTWYRGGRDRGLVAAFWVAMTMAQPFAEWIATMFLAGSYDTSPLHGVFRSVTVAVAAVVMLVTAVTPGRRPRLPGPVRRAVARPMRAVRNWWADGTAGPLSWRERFLSHPLRRARRGIATMTERSQEWALPSHRW
jgi:hypothetical protein